MKVAHLELVLLLSVQLLPQQLQLTQLVSAEALLLLNLKAPADQAGLEKDVQEHCCCAQHHDSLQALHESSCDAELAIDK